MATFSIYNKEGKRVGTVSAQSEGHAKNKAVEQNLVAGRRQISKVKKMIENDPYEQSWKDIYG